MKCLVYGAGVMGSYICHILMKNQENQVSLLARGRRADSLVKNGLRIYFLPSKVETHDRPKIVSSADEKYDIAFVAMQQIELQDAMERILAIKSRFIVFVGNNMNAEELSAKVEAAGKTAFFAFCAAGGYREKEKVIIGQNKSGTLSIGKVHDPLSPDEKYIIEKIFERTEITVRHFIDMDGWLKTHLAFILSIAALCYSRDCSFKKARHTDRKMVFDATYEAIMLLKADNTKIIPFGEDQYYIPGIRRQVMALIMQWLYHSRYGEVCLAAHLRHTGREMNSFYREWLKIKERRQLQMPVWEKLMGLVDWEKIAVIY